jgi:hypothetical protein
MCGFRQKDAPAVEIVEAKTNEDDSGGSQHHAQQIDFDFG